MTDFIVTEVTEVTEVFDQNLDPSRVVRWTTAPFLFKRLFSSFVYFFSCSQRIGIKLCPY